MSDAQKPEEQLPEGSQQKPEGISEPHFPADSVSDREQPSDTESKNQSRSKNERETAENKSSAPRVTTDSQPAKSSKSALVIAIIALLAVPAVGYWGYQQQTKLSSKLDSANAQLADELASKNSSLRNQLANLEGELARLDDEREAQNLLLERTQSRLSDAIKQVEAGRNTSEADWRLAEAQYLLRLANQRVLMEQRPEGALSMLRTADKVLAELDDVSLYGLRQSLAQDIAKLEAVPKLDVEGTYLRLAALINQSRELPTLSLEQQRQLPELLQEITPESVDETLRQRIRVNRHPLTLRVPHRPIPLVHRQPLQRVQRPVPVDHPSEYRHLPVQVRQPREAHEELALIRVRPRVRHRHHRRRGQTHRRSHWRPDY